MCDVKVPVMESCGTLVWCAWQVSHNVPSLKGVKWRWKSRACCRIQRFATAQGRLLNIYWNVLNQSSTRTWVLLVLGLGPRAWGLCQGTLHLQDSSNSSNSSSPIINRISKKIACDRSTASASDPTASTTTAATPATPATSDAAGDLAAAAAAAADPAAGTPASPVKNGVTEKLLEKLLDEERWQGDDAHKY